MQDNPGRDAVSSALGVAFIASVCIGLSMILRGRMAVGEPAARSRCSAAHPCRIASIGDSITAHPSGFATYPIPHATVVQMGVVGQGSAGIRDRLACDVIGSGFDEVIILAGANDLGRRDAAAYITANLRQMVQAASAAGLRVVLLTLTPYHAATSTISSINRTIKAQGRSWGADAIVDVHRPLASVLGHLRPEYVGDRMGLHPNAEGHMVMAVALRQQAYS